MSQLAPTPVANDATKPAWHSVMSRALLRPKRETYVTLVNEPGATTQRAFVWYFVAVLTSVALSILVESAVFIWTNPGNGSVSQVRDFLVKPQSWLLPGVVNSVFALGTFGFATAVTLVFARVVGGKGDFRKLVYVSSAIQSPLALFNPISYIPYISLFLPAVWVYGALLDLIALKAVNQFGSGRALVAILGAGLVYWAIMQIGTLMGIDNLTHQLYEVLNQ